MRWFFSSLLQQFRIYCDNKYLIITIIILTYSTKGKQTDNAEVRDI